MNIASVSWPDHLSFGEGDGRLRTPEAVAVRMRAWREELGAGALHWRLLRTRIPGTFEAADGYEHPSRTAACGIEWDDFRIVPDLARANGLEPWLYVSLFDEGAPLAPAGVRTVSHHNAMHGQHVAWQSDLTRNHPEWITVDREGNRQWGVVCLAYPEARAAFIDRWTRFLESSGFGGLFVCLRSQARPADHADQFGFNDPVGADIDVQARRDALGGYLTLMLAELRSAVRRSGHRLAVGVPRADVLGPPLGNATLAWSEWLDRRLVDAIVIDQHSSQCPSMWHKLWPMHRGGGYLQDYLDGSNLPLLDAHVAESYAPAARSAGVQLFVARQWHERSPAAEERLASIPGVTGLVFSSFRHDNPGAVARGDWNAGLVSENQQPD